MASLVAKVGRNPVVYGFYLRDEPGADMFPGLARVADLIRELAPGKWPYINLFPDYATPGKPGESRSLAQATRGWRRLCETGERELGLSQ